MTVQTKYHKNNKMEVIILKIEICYENHKNYNLKSKNQK